MGGTVGASVLGIYLALSGFGVWALVYTNLFNGIVDTVIRWISIRWRPIKAFSYTRLKSLLKYGSKLLGASLIQVSIYHLYDLIIGKVYTSADLAFYNQGRQMPDMVVNNLDDAVNSVMLPVLSNKQDDLVTFKAISKRALKTNMYIMTPFLFGLAAVSEQVIRIIYTEKWLFTVPYLMLFSVTQAFRPISTMNLSALKALGRSDLFLKIEVKKNILVLLALLITA